MTEMTRKALWAAIGEALSEAHMGAGSVRTSSWYADYASFGVACFPEKHATVVDSLCRHLGALATSAGWTELRISPLPNEVMVIFSEHAVISTGDRRMPN